MYCVILGTTDSLGRSIANAFNADNRYLGIRAGSLTELAPRQQILSTAYALVANKAGSSFSIGATSNILFQASGNSYFSGGNVGIGTKTPTVPLEVNGSIKANGKLTFEGGQGPLCMFFKECPNQWIDKGNGGFIINPIGACPYPPGGVIYDTWQWCLPRLCCNQ